jgi:hypothetical protein
MTIIEEVIAAYICDCRPHMLCEMRSFATAHRLEDAIQRAALCILPCGKRHPHQRRLSKAVLQEAEQRLQAVRDELATVHNFEDLYGQIEREIGPMRGIGALTVYDVAHRIGAFLGKKPSLVYLHAGTKRGAAAFGLKRASVYPDELPPPFSALSPDEIEDCLCIYKDELRESRIATAKAKNPAGPCFPLTDDNSYCGREGKDRSCDQRRAVGNNHRGKPFSS